MADAFDTKVTRLRNEAERNSQQLERRRERAPLQFMRVVQPVLAELLDEAEAVVMLDLRSVLLHDNVADVTDLAIMRINARIGEGPDTLPEPTRATRNGPGSAGLAGATGTGRRARTDPPRGGLPPSCPAFAHLLRPHARQ